MSSSYDSMGSFAPELDFAGYSTDNFYTRVKDTHGHKETWRYGPKPTETLAVPPELHAVLGELRAAFPQYRSNQDIFRDALVHLCHMRKEQQKAPSPAMIRALHKAYTHARLESLRAEYEANLSLREQLQQIVSGYNITKQQREEAFTLAREFIMTIDDPELRLQLEDLIRGHGG